MAVFVPKQKKSPSKKKDASTGTSVLKKIPVLLVCVIGLVLVLLIAGGIWFFTLRGGNNPFSRTGSGDGEAFYRELADFDALLVKSESFEKPETLNRTLDRLAKRALGVESHLSILKRRRLLARQDPRFIAPYQKAAQEVAEAIPSSESLAAVAAEAMLRGDPVIEGETGAQLRRYGSRLSETMLKPLALSLYILLGDLQDPFRAAAIPNKETLYSAVLPETMIGAAAPLNFDLITDLALLRIFRGDIPGATEQINTLIRQPAAVSGNPEFIRLAAEFFYDYDNPLRAAELFSQFSDEQSMARQADALWRAGYVSGARNLWTLLLSPKQSEEEGSYATEEIKVRSLYNLATTTEDSKEKIADLERFLAQGPKLADNFGGRDGGQSYYTYGTVYYTRLLDTPQSILILEKEQTGSNLLLDLELLRRRGEMWPVDKAVAETWLLLNRYPEDPRIYQWACYFFDRQRRYEETALLMKEADHRQINGPWTALHESIRLIREGRLEEAEQRLTAIAPPHVTWQVPANRAQILEIRSDPAGALEYYETASTLVKEKKSAAEIRFRISRCFSALDQAQESRRALEQALQFDPEYFSARLELQRMDR
ncbi:MAG: hypothetical protein LBD55_11305 [Treponema sp.]|jgi:tetratricopeptide (TPR) repeat protein|nr:hypothetical protein [Treponema sp.]